MQRYLLTLVLGTMLLVSSSLTVANTVAVVTVLAFVTKSLDCVINNNQAIEVDFGNDVITTKVDGKNYMQPVKYTLRCGGDTVNTLKLQIQGEPAWFNPALLATVQQSDLGIEIWADGISLPANSWLNFTYPNVPLLSAVPVKRSGSTLSAGKFSAAATMKIEVQ